MIIYTVISPEEIFFDQSQEKQPEQEQFSTDPYFYLNQDEYYKQYVCRRD